MKLSRGFIAVFLLFSFLPFKVYAEQGPRLLTRNRSLNIVEAGKVYTMVEFTPGLPIKIEVQGPGKLIIYIKTAIYYKYANLPAFKLFVRIDNYLTNQYLFPATTRSGAYFEGVKNYSPSIQTSSLPIDVPDGVHTYEIFLANKPYIIGLANFSYTPNQVAEKPVPEARKGSFMYSRTSSAGKSPSEKWFYIKPYGLFGDVYEQGTNNNSIYGGVGVNADIFLQKHLAISGIFNYTDADQRYLVWRNLPLPLGAGMYIVNEQTLLIQGIVSYAFLHNNKDIGMIGAGWGNLQLINPTFPGEVNGPLVSALFDIALSRTININFRPSYMQDLSNISASTNSILGEPFSLLMYPVGLNFSLSNSVSLGIGYDGRLLSFTHTNRFYNGGFVALIF
ncbi:MAG: hypothetical protein ACP5MB_09690 [bacterium]